jgi:probable DNA metabolism protein
MRPAVLAHEVDWGGWRSAARTLVLDGVPPGAVAWSVAALDAPPDEAAPGPPPQGGSFNVPRALVDLAQTVIQAREPARFDLLYRLLWRAHAGERDLLGQPADPDVQQALHLAQAVRQDTHAMREGVQFRAAAEPEGARYVAWFAPEHYILEANAAFFAARFAGMLWSILTPYRCAHWTGEAACFTAGVGSVDMAGEDALEAYWRAHCSAFFTPAWREGAIPCHYWRNLPAAAAVPDRMPSPAPNPTLAAAAREAAGCRACPLWEPATQTVFGEGPAGSRLMFIGEQPGDQEDLGGRPFIGPAGQLFDRALAAAGIDRGTVYVTNAVKHFKFEPRGKRRIHVKPDAGDIAACKFWLDLERREVKPAVTVLLGATAARAVLGRVVTISRERGRPIPLEEGGSALVTVHPSYLLRLPDEDSKRREYAAFVADLQRAVSLLGD